MADTEFWKGKRVLITGHTGFKGSWLTIWLNKLGAEVTGYALKEYPNDKLFIETKMSEKINDVRGNITDFDSLKKVFDENKPEIVFHLAAQPLVRKSFDEPRNTLKTNVMGTTNVLECIRLSDSIKTGVVITSDKCYKNVEQIFGYKEIDPMGGYDPYSCSKGCAELIIDAYRNSFFKKQNKFIASARAGNVIGGGDWSKDRLIPDCVKALNKGKPINLRNPKHTRPWQHVLEPLAGYILLAEKLYNEHKYDEGWNFGPNISSIREVDKITDIFVKAWGSGKWIDSSNPDDKHEATLLSLDISKARLILGWEPKLDIFETIKYTADWYKNHDETNAYDLCLKQINKYEEIEPERSFK